MDGQGATTTGTVNSVSKHRSQASMSKMAPCHNAAASPPEASVLP